MVCPRSPISTSAVYLYAGDPSPEVAVIQGATGGVGAGAGGVANKPVVSENALPNVACSL